MLAALNHPNIAAIYGLEKTAGLTALVMELVEGEDLSQHIARGALPLADALPIAKQIADALEAAHEHGIIHRDLKPQNIRITPDGTVKVLDFGLAKAMDPAGASGGEPLNSPTVTARATEMGMILGTAAYMAPEQARGKAVDRRADIWAFGVVLYEMLTGRRAFEGEDISITLANVLKDDVKWDALPADLPASIQRLLRRCLERDPKRRLSAIGDARLELDERTDPSDARRGDTASRVPSRTRERLIWAALVVIAVLTPLLMKWFAGAAAEPVVSRFELALPLKTLPLGWPDLSPDGRAIAVVVGGDDGIARISIRQLGAVTFQVLAGTEGASYPFWSPDSRSIGFFAGDTLKKIAIAGGPPQPLCPAARARGGTWGRTGVIVFSAVSAALTDGLEHLQQVAEAGGTPTVVTPLALPKLQLQRWPHFLPDGRHFLFFASARQTETDGVYVGSLDAAGATRLVAGFTEAKYSDGLLFFVRDSTLMAQPFDPARRVLGPAEAVPVASSIRPGGNEGNQGFSLSEAGLLVEVPEPAVPKYQLKWLDRSGRWLADLGAPTGQVNPRISPDGLRVLTASGDALWVTDAKSGRPQRLTFAEGRYLAPIWSRDATGVFFTKIAPGQGVYDLFRQPTAGGASQESLVADRVHHRPADVSPDGRYVLFGTFPTQSANDLWVLSLADRKPAPYVKNGVGARVSPDGRWAAYTASGSGGSEIYLESFPTPGANKFQITTGGGAWPVWSRDGRELFFKSGGKLMAVAVSTATGAPTIGQAVTLFPLPPQPNISANRLFGVIGGDAEYDVAPDGRFLFNVPVENQAPTAIVTLNWKAEPKKK